MREIDQILSNDGPLELLSVSLSWMRPIVIRNELVVANRQSSSEAIFQFELYASIRAILLKHDATRKVFAETRGFGEKKLDIMIRNGTSYGFELKLNKLRRRELEDAAEQADGYRRFLRIDKMMLVNFVPQGHLMDDVYHIEAFQDIQVIHVRYPVACDEYELKFLGENGERLSWKVRSKAL